VWRKLRKLGAVQLVDGLVALPATARTREQFDWLADEVLEAGGEAWTWTAVPGSKDQHKQLTARITEAIAVDYQAVLDEAEQVAREDAATRRTVERMRRELRRIEARDHVGSKDRDRAWGAVDRLAVLLDADDEASRL
jgi:hypothetical protein